MTAPAWMRRLSKEGCVLAPLPAGQGGYGVYAGSDRRRRPFARVGRAEVQRAISDGLLSRVEEGYRLSADGQGRLVRLQQTSDQPFADQHRKPARRQIMDTQGLRTVVASTAPDRLRAILNPWETVRPCWTPSTPGLRRSLSVIMSARL